MKSLAKPVDFMIQGPQKSKSPACRAFAWRLRRRAACGRGALDKGAGHPNL
jgi:hypothetical protein